MTSKVVSIPNRDFGKLQYDIKFAFDYEGKFQSLIGILVNCNDPEQFAKNAERVRFNP